MSGSALPHVRLSGAAGALPDRTSAAVAAVRVRTRMAMPAQCLLTLDPAAGAPGAARALEPGQPLRLDVVGHEQPLFAGEVTAVEDVCRPDGSRQVRVRGYDLLHRLRQRQSARVHQEVGLSDLATALCAGTGLVVDGPAAPRWQRLYQTGQSDLELLRDVAGRCGRYAVVDGPVLRLVDLGGWGEAVDLVLGENLHSATVQRTSERHFASVHGFRWGPARAEGGHAVVSVSPGPPSGGDRLLLGEAADEQVLQALVEAERAALTAGSLTATLVAAGDTRLRAGARVRLVGTPSGTGAPLVLTDALHVLDRSGWTATVSTTPPAVPPRRSGTSLTLGVVSAVDDPGGAGRVRVTLPAYAGVESGWAAVLVSGAADGQGAVLLPDVGDRVAVLLPQDEPEHLLVLGGLLGDARAADPGVEHGRVSRWTIGNRTGQRLVLDAGAQRLTLRGHNGSLIEMADDLLRICSSTDLVLEAPGRDLVVRARTVDFQEAP